MVHCDDARHAVPPCSCCGVWASDVPGPVSSCEFARDPVLGISALSAKCVAPWTGTEVLTIRVSCSSGVTTMSPWEGVIASLTIGDYAFLWLHDNDCSAFYH